MHLTFATGLFWLCVACAVVAQGFIVRSVRGIAHTRVLDAPDGDAAMPRRHDTLELLWAVLPAVGLVVLLVFTWRAVQQAQAPVSPVAPAVTPAVPA